MTPKEKAIDLVRDMEFEIPYIHDPTEPQGDDIAKRCALIAVEDIIRLLPNINETPPIYRKSDEFYFQYWQEVKQEIEKL
jgi:hypothetical protein